MTQEVVTKTNITFKLLVKMEKDEHNSGSSPLSLTTPTRIVEKKRTQQSYKIINNI